MTRMSVLHTILPLDDKCAEWLDSENIAHPNPSADSRFPTPGEIVSTAKLMAGYTMDASADVRSGEWSATITKNNSPDAWAFLRVSNYTSDEQPHEICFPKGSPEVIFSIVERLTHCCGPLVVVDDSAAKPVVVCPNDSVVELLRMYSSNN